MIIVIDLVIIKKISNFITYLTFVTSILARLIHNCGTNIYKDNIISSKHLQA